MIYRRLNANLSCLAEGLSFTLSLSSGGGGFFLNPIGMIQNIKKLCTGKSSINCISSYSMINYTIQCTAAGNEIWNRLMNYSLLPSTLAIIKTPIFMSKFLSASAQIQRIFDRENLCWCWVDHLPLNTANFYKNMVLPGACAKSEMLEIESQNTKTRNHRK